MPKLVEIAPLVIALLLSGCSDTGGDTQSSATTTSAAEHITNATDLPGVTILAEPREIFNESFRFKRSGDGQDITATFDVDNLTKRLGFRMDAYGDCPVTLGRASPQVNFTSPGGLVVVIDSFGGNRGSSFSAACDIGQLTGQSYLGSAEADAESAVGTWTLASQGEFTGDVRIIVTSDPAA